MLLQGVSGELTAAAARKLERIDSNGRHLLAIINEILDISRIEAGQDAAARSSEFTIPELIAEVMAELEPIIAALAARRCTTRRSRPSCRRSRSDRQKVKQIVLNLLTNALKFTPAGLRSRSPAALRRAARARSPSRSTDTGIGIAAEDQERDLRGLPAGRQLADPRLRRHRPGPVDLPPAGHACSAGGSPCRARWARAPRSRLTPAAAKGE